MNEIACNAKMCVSTLFGEQKHMPIRCLYQNSLKCHIDYGVMTRSSMSSLDSIPYPFETEIHLQIEAIYSLLYVYVKLIYVGLYILYNWPKACLRKVDSFCHLVYAARPV